MESYAPKITLWRIDTKAFPWYGGMSEMSRFPLRYAILAPTSQNTQP